jgi:3-phosphoshikimate 1-carboxyvinyltransferase
MVIQGAGGLKGAAVASEGDHRLAMAWAVAGLIASGETLVMDSDSVDISYPTFWQDISALSGTPVG